MRRRMRWSFVLAVSVLAAGLIGANAADDWTTVVAKAKKEGTVVVHGGPGTRYREALVTGFNKAYPDIKVQFSGASNRIDVPRILRERKASIFAWDVWVSGPSTAVNRLKPIGVFQPLEPILRADVKADANWNGGFAAGWMDNDGKYFYGFDGTVQHPIQVNWDFLKKSELTSIEDFIKPEFAGKIVWDDPRLNGSGNGASLTIHENFGEAFLRKLYQQNIVFSHNRRQQAEWLIRGRHPIAIGVGENDLDVFQQQGLGKNISPLPDSFYKIQQQSSGFGALGFVDKAPNPNAAAVYINWLLSREGQTEWVKVPRVSRRTDVVAPQAGMMPKAHIKYFNGQHEKHQGTRNKLLGVAREVIKGKLPDTGKGKTSE